MEQLNLFDNEELFNNKLDTQNVLNKIKQSKQNKSISTEKQLKSKDLTIEERLNIINENVNNILGKQKENTIVITNEEILNKYIETSIKNGYIAIDTETDNTLDYLVGDIMGLCLYTENEKQAYIPINHINYITNKKLDNQLSIDICRKYLIKLIKNNVKCIFHNYKFDYQVIKTNFNIEIPCFWDTMIGMKMINENESGSLKKLYCSLIDKTQEKYDIEHLFDAKYIRYAQVKPEIFALYSATDTLMTYKLYQYEKDILELDIYKGMYKIFKDIEIPLIKVVADMEYRGIGIDTEYVKRLQDKYNKIQEDINKEVQEEYTNYIQKIEEWKLTSEAQVLDGKKTKLEQLDNPINLDSPKQLAILLFDILKFPEGLGKTVYDTPRGTGANILDILYNQYNFKLGALLSKKKGIDKVVSTFISAIPNQTHDLDGKIHPSFNQLGAIARFSSGGKSKFKGIGGVNMQNIPSSIKDIRPMFNVNCDNRIVSKDAEYNYLRFNCNNKITLSYNDYILTTNNYKELKDINISDILVTEDNKNINIINIIKNNKDITLFFNKDNINFIIKRPLCVLVGADLSGAELRASVDMCKDKALVECYTSGRDLYSLVGSMAYNCSYEDACEFYPEGTEIEYQGEKVITGYKTHTNYIGKKHRNSAKRIAIGLVYSRGASSIAEQIGESVEKGKEILNNVNKAFPKLKEWSDNVKKQLLIDGYVDDKVGRRRHLPNALLPKYTFTNRKEKLNIFLNCNNKNIDKNLKSKYEKILSSYISKEDFNKIKKSAYYDGINIINNGSKIAEAQREGPNWQCQSLVADIIKLNMINIDNDKELKDLNAEILLTIHDELQLKCPIKNKDKVAERLAYLMSTTCKDLLCVPLPSDANIEHSGSWYMSELETQINNSYNNYKSQGLSDSEIMAKIYNEESQLKQDSIYNFIHNKKYLI